MNRSTILFVALFSVGGTAFGDNTVQKEQSSESTVIMSVPMLLATKTAFARFQKDQPTADIKEFLVAAREEVGYFEIVFMPKQNETKIVHQGNLDGIVMDNPSGNQHGRSIGYDVSKDSYTITKYFYAK